MDREHLIEFTQIAIKKAQTSEHMLNRVMPRDNIALCAVLRIKENVYSSSSFMHSSYSNIFNMKLKRIHNRCKISLTWRSHLNSDISVVIPE